MARNLSIVEAKTHLSDCIREVEKGRSLLITRHGKAVAALVPAEIREHVERLKKTGPRGGSPVWPAAGRDPKIWFAFWGDRNARNLAEPKDRDHPLRRVSIPAFAGVCRRV